MSNLIELQKSNLLRAIDSVQTDNNLKYLVLDETTEFLVGGILDRQKLLRSVTAVKRVDEKRTLNPQIDGIYILDPTRFSLNCLKTDFKVLPPRYKSMSIYLLPSPTVGKIMSDFLGTNNPVYSKLIRFIQVLNLNYYPLDSRIFLTTNDTTQDCSAPVHKTFDDDDPKLMEKTRADYALYSDKTMLNAYSLQIYYNPAFRSLVNYQIDLAVNGLLNVCISTNQYPIIRYYSPHVSLNDLTVVSRLIATKLQSRIDDYLRSNPEFNPDSSSSDRAVLLVADRSLDVLSIFMHEFTYESMLYDYIPKREFNSKNQVYFYTSQSERGTKLKKLSKLGLQGNDKYFERYRFLDIATAYDELDADIKQLIADNPLLVNRMEAKDASDMLDIMANSAEFDDERRLLYMHKQLIERILNINKDYKLLDMVNLEQNLMADLTDHEGLRLKYLYLVDDMVQFLDNMKGLDVEYRIRVVVIFALTKPDGILESDLLKLMHFLAIPEREIPSYVGLFKNLSILNRDVIKQPDGHHHHRRKEYSTQYGETDNTGSLTARYQPAIAKIIKELSRNNNAELKEFRFANEAHNKLMEEESSVQGPAATTSLRNQKLIPSWSAAKSSSGSFKRQKMFIYIAGGITTGEIRTVRELSDKLNKDIYLGSENILLPNETVFNVQNLTNSNPKELNPLIPFKLKQQNVEQAPQFLLDSGIRQAPPPQQRQPKVHQPVQNYTQTKPQPVIPNYNNPNNNLTGKKDEKKHKFGKFMKRGSK